MPILPVYSTSPIQHNSSNLSPSVLEERIRESITNLLPTLDRSVPSLDTLVLNAIIDLCPNQGISTIRKKSHLEAAVEKLVFERLEARVKEAVQAQPSQESSNLEPNPSIKNQKAEQAPHHSEDREDWNEFKKTMKQYEKYASLFDVPTSEQLLALNSFGSWRCNYKKSAKANEGDKESYSVPSTPKPSGPPTPDFSTALDKTTTFFQGYGQETFHP